MGRLYDNQGQPAAPVGGRLFQDSTIASSIQSSVASYQKAQEEFRKQQQEIANPTKAIYRGPASTVELNKDDTLAEWDKLNEKTKNLFVNSLKENIKKGDQDAALINYWLEQSGKYNKSFLGNVKDAFLGSVDTLGGGLNRATARTADFLIPGQNSLGIADIAQRSEEAQRERAQYSAGGQLGRTAGSVAKGAFDVASLALPVTKIDRVADASRLINTIRETGGIGRAAAWAATRVPGSLAGTGIGAIQDIGRGKDPELTKNLGIGLATDIALPATLKGLKPVDNIIGRGIASVAGDRPVMTSLKNDGVFGTLDKVVSNAMKGAGYKVRETLEGTSIGTRLVGLKDTASDKFVDELGAVYRTLKKDDFITGGNKYAEARDAISDSRRFASFAEDFMRNDPATVKMFEAVRSIDNDIDKGLKVADDYMVARQELDLYKGGQRNLTPELVAKYEKQVADNVAGEQAYQNLAQAYQNLNKVRLDSGLISQDTYDLWQSNPVAYAKNTALLDDALKRGAISDDVYAKVSTAPIGDEQNRLITQLVESGDMPSDVADNLLEGAGYIRQQKELSDYRIKKQRSQQGAVASIGSTTSSQKRNKKDIKNILSPTTTYAQVVQQTFREAQRNKAANTLSGLLQSMGEAKVLGKAPGPNIPTISKLVDGKRVWVQVEPEIEAAIKGWDSETTNVLINMLRPINNVFRAGTTGYNPAFAVTNPVRDLVSGSINSQASLRSYNPISLVNSLFATLGKPLNQTDTELFNSFAKANKGAYSINQYTKTKTSQAIAKQKALVGSSAKQRWSNYVIHPSKAVRQLADGFNELIGTTEQLVRYAGFRGTAQKAIAQGASLEEATRIANRAAREDTVDFMAAGSWGKVINSVLPYSNAGVQGSRALLRNMASRPVSTTAKITTLVGIPVATTTIWNNMDEDRKNIYNTIPDYVKSANFVIIKPGAKWNESKRRWDGVVLIPKPPGISDLVEPTRRYIEYVFDNDPEKSNSLISFMADDIGQTTNNLAGVMSPIDFSDPYKFLASVTPQALKPTAEAILAKDFFSGRDLIPGNLQDLPADQQKFEQYSQLTSYIGNLFNTSPLRVDKWIKATFGEVGVNAVNLADKTLLAAGVSPGPQAVGGRDLGQSVERRFVSPGGADETAFYKVYNASRAIRNQISREATALIQQGKENEAKMVMERFNKRIPELYAPFKNKYGQSPTFNAEWDKLMEDLELSTKDSAIKRRKEQ